MALRQQRIHRSSTALGNVLLGLQPGETPQEYDLTYGVALRLLDERLVIRGEGVYQQLENRPASEGLQGEVAVEVRLTPKVALEVFYRREGDVLGGTGTARNPRKRRVALECEAFMKGRGAPASIMKAP